MLPAQDDELLLSLLGKLEVFILPCVGTLSLGAAALASWHWFVEDLMK